VAPDHAEIHEHYARGEERDRLLTPFGQVEFTRTCEILERHLPSPPAVVADVGGGPGRYSLWLAERGYTVRHRDLVALHVEQLAAAAAARGLTVDSTIADARRLDLPDASVDAVLLLGPVYHLPTRDDRVAALAEAARVVRPGGPVFAVAISRWAPRLHGEVADRLGEEYASMRRRGRSPRAPAGSRRSSPGRSAGSATGPTTSATRCSPPGSSASIASGWRGWPLRLPIWRSGSPRRSRAPSSSRRPGRSSAFPSFWASARTCWRRLDAPDLCLAKRFARLRGRARRARGL
jgi:SAM-dependent methyltransferase